MVCSFILAPQKNQYLFFFLAFRNLSSHSTSSQLLLQAVRSYIHFSQIRSWQEVGGKDHTPFPLQLEYRVCSGSMDGNTGKGFSPYSAHHHTFPPLHLSPHTSLLVAVATLPRLPQIPQQLLALPTAHSKNHDTTPTCSRDATPTSQRDKSPNHHSSNNGVSRYQASETSLTSAPVPLGVDRLTRACPKEGFPFSPPLPSPLSPKLLMGLADNALSLDTHGMPELEKEVGKISLVDSNSNSRSTGDLDFDPTKTTNSDPMRTTRQVYFDPKRMTKPVNSDVRTTAGQLDSDLLPTPSDNTREGGGGAVPPASCSPAPFSRMHMGRERGRERGGAKRRSCAIVCKVSRSLLLQALFEICCMCF